MHSAQKTTLEFDVEKARRIRISTLEYTISTQQELINILKSRIRHLESKSNTQQHSIVNNKRGLLVSFNQVN